MLLCNRSFLKLIAKRKWKAGKQQLFIVKKDLVSLNRGKKGMGNVRGSVQTVIGVVDPEDLGITYPHEHLINLQTEETRDPDFVLDSVEKAIEEVGHFKKAGGQTIVEMTPINSGRSLKKLEEVAKRTGTNIIAATGFFRGPYQDWVNSSSEEELSKLFVKEVERGIEGTDIKAGVIKIGSSYNHIRPDEERVIRAAAKAHLATGAPISSHTEIGTMGLEQLEILEEEGANLEKVIIGHLDRNPDYNYHKAVAEKGAFVEYDCIGKIKYYPDSMRVELIIKLIKEGYGGNILLSGDMGRRSYWKAYGGGPGLDYILTKFVPRLRREALDGGLKTTVVDDLLLKNPTKAFTFYK